jgi:hypothetical protein
MPVDSTTNLDYLIDSLRLHLGDTTAGSYRYTDEWLRTSLVMSVKALQRWWDYKYLVDTDYNVYRNQHWTYLFPEPPIIEHGDESPVILMASIIIKEGSLENNSWSVGSWKDAEIAYSNIEGNKAKVASIEKDREALEDILKPPTKRLARTKKGSLPGYKGNEYERVTKY